MLERCSPDALLSQAFLGCNLYSKDGDCVAGHVYKQCSTACYRFCQIKLAVLYILQDCIFLEDKLCSIYQVRPTQCATYPWWPDLMNPVSWQVEAAEVCEGLDHEDAESLDVQQASEKLMTAAEYFVMKDAAPRRTKT